MSSLLSTHLRRIFLGTFPIPVLVVSRSDWNCFKRFRDWISWLSAILVTLLDWGPSLFKDFWSGENLVALDLFEHMTRLSPRGGEHIRPGLWSLHSSDLDRIRKVSFLLFSCTLLVHQNEAHCVFSRWGCRFCFLTKTHSVVYVCVSPPLFLGRHFRIVLVLCCSAHELRGFRSLF